MFRTTRSGAIHSSAAAILAGKVTATGRVVVVVSGGNVSDETLAGIGL